MAVDQRRTYIGLGKASRRPPVITSTSSRTCFASDCGGRIYTESAFLFFSQENALSCRRHDVW